MKFASNINGMELTKLNKTELEEIHTKEIGEVPTGATKASLIDAIEEARKASGATLTIQEDESEFFDHTLTEADIEANPELAEAGLKVGDVVKVPKESDQDQTYHDMYQDKAEDELLLIKHDEDGNLIDTCTMKADTYAMLPAHKCGWEIAPPKEIA
jgi:hypothetical protein